MTITQNLAATPDRDYTRLGAHELFNESIAASREASHLSERVVRYAASSRSIGESLKEIRTNITVKYSSEDSEFYIAESQAARQRAIDAEFATNEDVVQLNHLLVENQEQRETLESLISGLKRIHASLLAKMEQDAAQRVSDAAELNYQAATKIFKAAKLKVPTVVHVNG